MKRCVPAQPSPGARLSWSWSQACPVASNLFCFSTWESCGCQVPPFPLSQLAGAENPSWPQGALGFQDGKFLEEQVVRGEGREAQARPLLLLSDFPGAEEPVFPAARQPTGLAHSTQRRKAGSKRSTAPECPGLCPCLLIEAPHPARSPAL